MLEAINTYGYDFRLGSGIYKIVLQDLLSPKRIVTKVKLTKSTRLSEIRFMRSSKVRAMPNFSIVLVCKCLGSSS